MYVYIYIYMCVCVLLVVFVGMCRLIQKHLCISINKLGEKCVYIYICIYIYVCKSE